MSYYVNIKTKAADVLTPITRGLITCGGVVGVMKATEYFIGRSTPGRNFTRQMANVALASYLTSPSLSSTLKKAVEKRS